MSLKVKKVYCRLCQSSIFLLPAAMSRKKTQNRKKAVLQPCRNFKFANQIGELTLIQLEMSNLVMIQIKQQSAQLKVTRRSNTASTNQVPGKNQHHKLEPLLLCEPLAPRGCCYCCVAAANAALNARLRRNSSVEVITLTRPK